MRLQVPLRARTRIQGTVDVGTAPAKGAVVELQKSAVPQRRQFVGASGVAVRTTRDRPCGATTTDADGRFMLGLPEEGSFYVRARLPGYAPAELGPMAITPGVPVTDLELHLTRGGRIQGRLRLGEGQSPAGAVVAAHRGDGIILTKRVDPEGGFVFDRLTPGRWEVAQQNEEYLPGGRKVAGVITSKSRDQAVEWSCEVFEGETTYVELGSEVACTLEGSIEHVGHSVEGWSATLHKTGRVSGASNRGPQQVPVGAEGRFKLHAEEQGHYALSLRSGGPEEEAMYVIKILFLSEGENEWHYTLRTAPLEGAFGPDARSMGRRLNFSRLERDEQGEGWTLCTVPVVHDGLGGFACPDAPVGHGFLVTREWGAVWISGPQWPKLIEVEVLPGGTFDVFLP